MASVPKSRVQFLIGAGIVLVLALAFAAITMWALRIRSQTGSEFSKYVVSHHLGTAEVTDDASGFQTDFCVLHLNAAIPDSKLKTETVALFTTYHQLDGGDHLTLEYAGKDGKTVIQSDAVLVGNTNVSLTLHTLSGVQTTLVKLPPA